MNCIYKIVNTVNNMVYIGFTGEMNTEIRWGLHRREARRHQHRPLYRAMNEYGIDKFSMHIIEKVNDLDAVLEREQFWIDSLNSMHPNGYNAARACGLRKP